MKQFIYILLFISPLISTGQNCKYEKNEVDLNTQLRIKRTEPVTICRVNNQPFLVKAQSIGKNKYLKFRYFRYNNFRILPGSEMVFTLSDNTSVSLTSIITPADTAQNNNSFTTISSLLIFKLSDTDFEKLMSTNVIRLKYFKENGYVNKIIKEKNQETIRQILKCIK
ncbi:MAG: hypothetical protein KAT68_03100 [Bacteroidales bacterium]|nr:hypothetical protein [Bacteroidales bacterium]